MAEQKQNSQSSSILGGINTSTVMSIGVPVVLVAGVGFYFYRQNSSNVARISELEARIKVLEEIISKQKEQIDGIVSNWQTAFGSLQNQISNINPPQPRYKSQAPPPSYAPDDEEFEDAPREIKKKAKALGQQAGNIKEQAEAIARERER
jgi:hypothetical protein